MRRMRDLPWHYYLLAIPAVGAAIGIQYSIRKTFPEAIRSDVAMVLKPSHFRPDSGNENRVNREIASRSRTEISAEADSEDAEFNALEDVASNEAVDAGEVSEKEADEARYKPNVVQMNTHRDPASENTAEAAPADTNPGMTAGGDVSAKEVTEGSGATAGNQCSSIEYRGDGPLFTKVNDKEWEKVMTQFHDVKGQLLSWLQRHRKEFPDKTSIVMEGQIQKIQIQRPPATEEPDLTWRGIGVWTQDQSGAPVIRMGSGLVKLMMKQPIRGRFELARLVAQAWAPCELMRMDAAKAWDPFLKCLGVEERKGCSNGTYSEAGWAVSTAMAAIVAPPGCTVPAFASPTVASCLKKPPLPLSIAEADFTSSHVEARR